MAKSQSKNSKILRGGVVNMYKGQEVVPVHVLSLNKQGSSMRTETKVVIAQKAEAAGSKPGLFVEDGSGEMVSWKAINND